MVDGSILKYKTLDSLIPYVDPIGENTEQHCLSGNGEIYDECLSVSHLKIKDRLMNFKIKRDQHDHFF